MKGQKLNLSAVIISIVAFVTMLMMHANLAAQVGSMPNLKFTTYTTQSGLADNTIIKMVKDKRGFLWVATLNGISRFDGLRFKTYTHIPSDTNTLRSIWITDLIIDANKTLWATTEGGVCYYDEVYDRFRYINSGNEMAVIYKAPLFSDGGPFIWVAAENGLLKIDIALKKIIHTSLGRIPDPQAVIRDDWGNILVGTRGFGMYSYNPTTNKYKSIRFACLKPNEHIMGFYKDSSGVWAATSMGLLLIKNNEEATMYTTGSQQLQGVQVDQLMCINSYPPLTDNSKLICGTYDKKMLLFDKNTNTFIYNWATNIYNPDNVPSGIYYSFYNDGQDLWIATDHGLGKYSPIEQDFVTNLLPPNLVEPQLPLVKKMVAAPYDSRYYWMILGHPKAKIVLYDAALQKIVTTVNTQSKRYVTMSLSSINQVYALSDSLLEVFSPNGQLQKKYPLPLQCFSMEVLDNGNVWIGTETGLLLVNTHSGVLQFFNCNFKGTEVENSSFPQAFRTSSLCLDRSGTIWLSSIKYGLFSFDTITHQFLPHRQAFTGTYSTQNRIASLVIRDNEVWCGTMSGITNYKPANNTFTNYNATNGLQSTYVYALAKDSLGTIWARGNTGVFSLDPISKKVYNYDVPLPYLGSLIYQQLNVVGGGITLGFEGGYGVFTSPKIENNSLPRAIITSCKLTDTNYFFNKDSVAQQAAVFSYRNNNIQFSFTAIQFNYPEAVSLYYKLEGINENWLPAGKNTLVSFNNLSGGTYSFKVMALVNGSTLFSEPAIFKFRITPPFWRTWWFRLLAFISIVTMVTLLFKYRVRMIRQRAAQNTALNKTLARLEMQTLRSRMNPHFIFNSLNSIQKFIWENKKDDASDYLSKFAKLIRLILDHSANTFISLAEELEALKIYMELEHRRCNGRFEYAIRVSKDIDADATKIPPLILQPFVENAIWHGLSPLQNKIGVLSVSITQKDGSIICTITDNGIGRAKAAELKAQSSIVKTSVGLDITKQRLAQIQPDNGSQYFIETTDLFVDNQSDGTCVIIGIPEIKE